MRLLLALALTFLCVASNTAFAVGVGPTSVPEPATVAMLGVGVVGLALARKFRRRK